MNRWIFLTLSHKNYWSDLEKNGYTYNTLYPGMFFPWDDFSSQRQAHKLASNIFINFFAISSDFDSTISTVAEQLIAALCVSVQSLFA